MSRRGEEGLEEGCVAAVVIDLLRVISRPVKVVRKWVRSVGRSLEKLVSVRSRSRGRRVEGHFSAFKV